MKGRTGDVPNAERRRTANAALRDCIEEVCRQYAPSGARAEDCWEVRDAGDRVALRVFLAGPMQGSWNDAVTGERGDALELVAHLRCLDAAGALAEAEAFLSRGADEPGAGEAGGGGQMALFGALPERRERKRPARRSAKGRKAGASRQAATTQHDAPASDAAPPSGDEPAGPGDTPVRSQASPDVPAPEDRKVGPPPVEPAHSAGPGPRKPGHPATDAAGAGFFADDRQRLRKSAEDAAWIRSHLTVRSLDAGAHERAKARRQKPARRWRRAIVEAVALVALAAVWLAVGVSTEHRYGVSDLVAAYGFELVQNAPVLLGDGP